MTSIACAASRMILFVLPCIRMLRFNIYLNRFESTVVCLEPL